MLRLLLALALLVLAPSAQAFDPLAHHLGQ